MVSESSPPTFSAWLHSWRYFFWFLGLIIGVTLFYGEENWRGHRAWEHYRRAGEAKGLKMRASDFIPPQVPDEQNQAMTPILFRVSTGGLFPRQGQSNCFGARYNAASSIIKASKGSWGNSWTRRTDLAAWYAAFLASTNTAERKRQEIAVRTNFALAEAATGVLAGLEDCDEGLQELRRSSQLPYCRFNLNYDAENPAIILLPHLAPLKNLCQVLRLRASAEIAAGQGEAALADINLALSLTDACREEPILISQLVRIAQLSLVLQPIAEGLAAHQWSEAQLKALQERLGQFDFCADMKRVLEAECVFFGCGVIQYVERNRVMVNQVIGDSHPSGDLSEVGMVLLTRAAPSGWFSLEKLNYTRNLHEFLSPAIDLARHQVHPAASRAFEQRISEIGRSGPAGRILRHELFSSMMLGSLGAASQRAAFGQAGAEAAALGCALERYRLAHGEFPASLEALAPQFMNLIPHDIISGGSLKYRRTPDGQYVLYSVGWNETDDGGVVALTKSEENIDQKQGDWVWQVESN